MSSSNLTRFAEIGKKIVCVGRNYAEHAAELGNALPTEPMLFLKPSTAYLQQGKQIMFPPGCKELHYEVELGLVISKTGTDIPESEVMNHIGGYALALDMTARDFQNAAKKKGIPWSLAKGFNTSCPISQFIPKESVSDPQNIGLWCKVNGETKQDGNTKDMIFNIPTLVSYISQYFTLETGDLVLTGTPAGVGPVVPGDVITAGLGDMVEMSFTVGERK